MNDKKHDEMVNILLRLERLEAHLSRVMFVMRLPDPAKGFV